MRLRITLLFAFVLTIALQCYAQTQQAASQPTHTVKIGTIGGSYNGRIQWLTALEQPPHLTTMIAMVTPSDPCCIFPAGTTTSRSARR